MYDTFFTADTISSVFGNANFSKFSAYGIGTSFPLTLIISESRKSKQFDWIK